MNAICVKCFERYSDLESHIKSNHVNHNVFQCDQCGKSFVLKWRLGKHLNLHTGNSVKHCHFFNNDKKCPFEVLGCKFLHSKAKVCKAGQNCQRRLCPLRHSEDELDTDSDVITTIGDDHTNETEGRDTSEFHADEPLLTSTPQKVQYECEECINKTQCTDCFVRQYMAAGQIMYGGDGQKISQLLAYLPYFTSSCHERSRSLDGGLSPSCNCTHCNNVFNLIVLLTV